MTGSCYNYCITNGMLSTYNLILPYNSLQHNTEFRVIEEANMTSYKKALATAVSKLTLCMAIQTVLETIWRQVNFNPI